MDDESTGVNFSLPLLGQALQESAADILQNCRSPIAPCSDFNAFPEFKIHTFATVSSTNTVTWELLQQGTGAGTVVIALSQQAGRGQRGHHWYSASGGLYLSLGLTPNLPVAQAAGLTLSSAWGVATALRTCGIPVQIKWLNDLVVAGRKLGGILTETRIAKAHIQQAVIGVGVNWRNAVPDLGVNLQTVQAALPQQAIDSLEKLAAIVLQGLRLGYCDWQQQGVSSLIAGYEALLVNLGEAVMIDGNPGEIIGITPAGQLRVRLHSPHRTELCLEPGAVCLGYKG